MSYNLIRRSLLLALSSTILSSSALWAQTGAGLRGGGAPSVGRALFPGVTGANKSMLTGVLLDPGALRELRNPQWMEFGESFQGEDDLSPEVAEAFAPVFSDGSIFPERHWGGLAGMIRDSKGSTTVLTRGVATRMRNYIGKTRAEVEKAVEKRFQEITIKTPVLEIYELHSKVTMLAKVFDSPALRARVIQMNKILGVAGSGGTTVEQVADISELIASLPEKPSNEDFEEAQQWGTVTLETALKKVGRAEVYTAGDFVVAVAQDGPENQPGNRVYFGTKEGLRPLAVRPSDSAGSYELEDWSRTEGGGGRLTVEKGRADIRLLDKPRPLSWDNNVVAEPGEHSKPSLFKSWLGDRLVEALRNGESAWRETLRLETELSRTDYERRAEELSSYKLREIFFLNMGALAGGAAGIISQLGGSFEAVLPWALLGFLLGAIGGLYGFWFFWNLFRHGRFSLRALGPSRR